MAASPAQRSLKYYRDQGYTCQVVERWNAYAGIRQDLFQIIDIVAIKPGVILGIQATGITNFFSHKKKILESEYLAKWLEAGGRMELIGWKRVGRLWQPRVEEIKNQPPEV